MCTMLGIVRDYTLRRICMRSDPRKNTSTAFVVGESTWYCFDFLSCGCNANLFSRANNKAAW